MVAVLRALRPLKNIQESLTVRESSVEDITGKLITVFEAIAHFAGKGTLKHRAVKSQFFLLGLQLL